MRARIAENDHETVPGVLQHVPGEPHHRPGGCGERGADPLAPGRRGIGPVECVNVEHEEVLLIPRWVDAQRVTFKYGLGAEFIEVLRTLHKLGLDSTKPVSVRGAQVAPRDVVV